MSYWISVQESFLTLVGEKKETNVEKIVGEQFCGHILGLLENESLALDDSDIQILKTYVGALTL